MAYSTQAQIEAILGRSLTADETTLLAGIQAGADKWIDAQTGVSFGDLTGSKYYDGGLSVLAIDPVRSITAIELVDYNLDTVYTYVEDQDYIVLPENDGLIRALQKRSYPESVFFDSLDGDAGVWPHGLKRIKVTGNFSYADTVPDDLSYLSAYLSAKKLLAKGYLASGGTGPKTKEEIEGYKVEFAGSSASQSSYSALVDDEITTILAAYSDQEIFF